MPITQFKRPITPFYSTLCNTSLRVRFEKRYLENSTVFYSAFFSLTIIRIAVRQKCLLHGLKGVLRLFTARFVIRFLHYAL